MKSLAVIRSDEHHKLWTALNDLRQHAGISFSDVPRQIDPVMADEVLTKVMNAPLKNRCKSAAIVGLKDNAGAAIGSIRRIHPPAHIIIVSPRHSIFEELKEQISSLPLLQERHS